LRLLFSSEGGGDIPSPDVSQALTTRLFAGLAILVALVVLYLGFQAWRRWRAATEQLKQVARVLETTHGTRGHRVLYQSFDALMLALEQAGKSYHQFQWIFKELHPALLQFHRRAIAGAGAAWEEIRNAFLERARHPIRLTRAAAGWVVLLGLAGTVLGFLEVIPALREVLTAPAQGISAPTDQTAAKVNASDANADGASMAGRKLRRVLGSLQGLFWATFFGVFSATLLSMFNLALFEPAFDRFASEIDIFGGRWFVPLIQAPDTLVDDALRGELRSYFDQIGKQLELSLAPLISQLRNSLDTMLGLSNDFSGNIRMGVNTLETFHEAVGRLGSSAQGAVDQLVQIVKTSSDFVREVETLQQKGMEQLSVVLSGPAERLAGAATSMEDRVQDLNDYILDISRSTIENQKSQQTFAQEVSRFNEALEEQGRSFSRLEGDLDSLGLTVGDGIRKSLTPLIQSLHEGMLEFQRHAAAENRAAMEQIASGLIALREILATRVSAPQIDSRFVRESEFVSPASNKAVMDQIRLLGDIRSVLNQLLAESREARRSWAGRTYERLRNGTEDRVGRLWDWLREIWS
jgi:hypothetical protein